MRRRCLEHLPAFAMEFKEVQKVAPDLISPLCATVVMMNEPGAMASFSLDHLSKWPVRKGKFEECELFKQFEEERDVWIFEGIKKDVDAERKVRLDRLAEIYPKIRSTQNKAEATIIRSIFEQPSQEDTLIFLLEDTKRCAVLKEWFGGQKV